MIAPSLRILIIEDSPFRADKLSTELRRLGCAQEPLVVASEPALREALRQSPWDAALVGWAVPGLSGPAAMALIRASDPRVRLIAVSPPPGDEAHGADGRIDHDDLRGLDAALAPRAAGAPPPVEAGQLLESVFEAVRDPIAVLDLDGRVIRGNRAFAALVGRPAEDLVGRSYCATVHGPGVIPSDCPFVAMRKSGTRATTTYRIGDRWHEVSVEPGVGPDGVRWCVHAMRDVTDRVKALARTTEQLRFQQILMDALPFSAYYKDRDLRYRGANQAFLSKLGISLEDLVGKTVHEVAPIEQADPQARVDQELIEHPGTRTYESRSSYADGTTRDLVVTKATYTDAEGQVAGVIGAYVDVSDRRLLETQLLQAQKMEAIGQLAGGVAHDFNNILTAIMGYSQLLLMRLPPGHTLSGFVTQILAACHRAVKLTQNLLVFGRKQESKPEPLDLREVVESQRGLLRQILGEDIKLRIDARPDEVAVVADRAKLEQILLNLGVNSRDAMPAGGVITLAVGREKPPGESGDWGSLSFADNGIGMDRHTAERVFEPFFTTKERGRGTGLGLSIVWGIVQEHGGRIRVESRPGAGTTFFIHLPLASAEGKAAELQEAPEPAGGTETLIVAEDDELVRDFAATVLRSAGYTVIEACDGDDALALLGQGKRIDLMLLDIVMPGRSGRSVFEEARIARPEVKVALMSGHSRDVLESRGLALPGVAIIEKPFSADSLSREVRALLDEAR